MPVQPTFPGVYIEEIPSGVHTITGVATSITAFIGRALRGPVNEATTINSFADFERIFGGLWVESTLGYAVRDFYLNGGSQAIIVRLFSIQAGAPAAKASFSVSSLPFEAASEGTWGANLRARVDFAVSEDVANAMGLTKADLFNLSVRDASTGLTEAFHNLTVKGSPLRVDNVLEHQSQLIRWAGTSPPVGNELDNLTKPGAPPSIDNVTQAEQALATAKNAITFDIASQTRNVVQRRQQDTTNAQQQVDTAQKALDDAKKLVPPDPAKVNSAQQALDTARQALQTAQAETYAFAAQEVLTDAQTALATAQQANRPPAEIAADQKAVNDATTAQGMAPLLDTANTVQANLDTAKGNMQGSDGKQIAFIDFVAPGNEANKLGLYALEQADLFNLLCIPPYKPGDDDSGDIDVDLVSFATVYCEKRRAMLLVDAPSSWTTKALAVSQFLDPIVDNVGTRSKNAAIFFPRLRQPNILHNNQVETFVPCGTVAGIFARTDTTRGVWKAPAGLETSLVGAPQLSVNLTDLENGELNPLGINCIRAFPLYGRVVWGARTLRGADQFADEYKYIPVRRTALFIEESLYRGTQWVVFEPNDEPLWAQIRLNVGAFMHNLFRQGAFQGKTPTQAYLVKCDSETTTQNDIDLGIVNILVAFAPLKPAEFVIIQIKQLSGQIEV